MSPVAVVQLNATADAAANVDRASAWVREAARSGAGLVALPEAFPFIGPEDEKLRVAETLDGPTCQRMADLARELGIWLLAGSVHERSPDPGRVYNTSVLYGPRGDRVAVYRKVHLFDVAIPGGAEVRESATVLPGGELVVADTPWGPAGLSVCYDLRFPEIYRALVARGARLLFVPSAFTAHTGKDHWEVLLRARAIEDQAFVIAPGQWGPHGGRRASHGRSMIVDPWGTVLATVPDGEGFALARLDRAAQDRIRSELPALRHARLPWPNAVKAP